MLKQQCFAIVVASVLGVGSLEAAPILVPKFHGSIVGSVITDATSMQVLGYDFSILGNGLTLVEVKDGDVVLDEYAGNDTVPAATGTSEFVIFTPDFAQYASVNLDFGQGRFDGSDTFDASALTGATRWIVPGQLVIAPASPAITDPLLLSMLGPVEASFHFALSFEDSSALVHAFNLDSVTPVPEPATASLFGLGLAAVAGRRRFAPRAKHVR